MTRYSKTRSRCACGHKIIRVDGKWHHVEPHPPGKEQLACDNTCPARCPGCENGCPLWEHDEQVKRKAREEVLNEMRDLVRNAKKYGTIEPEELFHWTGIIAMIESLRSDVKKV